MLRTPPHFPCRLNRTQTAAISRKTHHSDRGAPAPAAGAAERRHRLVTAARSVTPLDLCPDRTAAGWGPGEEGAAAADRRAGAPDPTSMTDALQQLVAKDAEFLCLERQRRPS